MDNALDQYIDRVDALLRRLSPSEQAKLSRNIGTQIRLKNKQRIQANTAPSGEAFTARQSVITRPFSGSLKPEQNFMYQGKLHRYRTLKDYGTHYIGWNYRTRNTFKALKERVRQPSGALKNRLMFRKIHQFKYLKMKAQTHQVAIGFMTGLTGYIAAAHQYGEDNRPERQLLGFADDDLQLIEDLIVAHLET